MKHLAIIPLTLVLFLASCGYRVAGTANRLPKEVHTIAIPGFANQTQTYKIEQLLTSAVVREFLTRTHYRIINEVNTSADATLQGTVLTVQVAPVTYDSVTGRASSALVTVTTRITLMDRHNKKLFEQPNYVFRDQYQVSRELSSFFQEESPAMDRLSREFARTLVSNILEAF